MMKSKSVREVVINLRNLADSIEGLVSLIEINQTKPEEIKSKPVKEDGVSKEGKTGSTNKEKQPTLEEVRAVLAKLSQDGKQKEVKSLITQFDASKLSDISPDNYKQLLKKAEEI